jgi:hypothetical protein
MENWSPAEVWAAILATASAIVLIANAAEKIAKAVKAAKAPGEQQDKRLEDLERRMEAAEKKLDNDSRHFDAIDASNRVTQVALLALLDHGIDGNNVEQMQHAKEELQTHLINR